MRGSRRHGKKMTTAQIIFTLREMECVVDALALLCRDENEMRKIWSIALLCSAPAILRSAAAILWSATSLLRLGRVDKIIDA